MYSHLQFPRRVLRAGEEIFSYKGKDIMCVIRLSSVMLHDLHQH